MLKVQVVVDDNDQVASSSSSSSSSSELSFFVEDRELSLTSRDLAELPKELGALPSLPEITTLDLSTNRFRKLPKLDAFPCLQRLVLDNNQLTHESFAQLPRLPQLDTLWVNNNLVKDVAAFVDAVAGQVPNLTWLSLLKNPGCPDVFNGRDDDDYRRHRLFVVSRMKKLRYLDSLPVTPSERAEAKRVGHLMKTARGQQAAEPVSSIEDELEAQGLRPLPASITRPGKGATTFGVSRYVYYGKQSEGNRFIRDDAL